MLRLWMPLFFCLFLSNCLEESNSKKPAQQAATLPQSSDDCSKEAIDECLRKKLAAFKVTKVNLAEFSRHTPAQVHLGQMLFFDKVLSGNNDMACATCHHPEGHTADRFSLSAGSGSDGHRQNRRVREFRQLVPRHTPSLFNRGHRSFTRMFWDGRVSTDETGQLKTPAKERLIGGLESVLAAQALFPPTSPVEMRGHPGDNEVADLKGFENIWPTLYRKIVRIPEYQTLLRNAYPNKQDYRFSDLVNAIAAFESVAFRSVESPFDRYLADEQNALTLAQKRGALVFYGKARCAKCHSGPFQSDHKFYNIGSPQFGPGKKDGLRKNEDYGRERVTQNRSDKFRFKTAPLRNVELTPPYGRTGAFPSLEAIIRHKIRPIFESNSRVQGRLNMPMMANLSEINAEILPDGMQQQIVAENDLPKGVNLSDGEVADLVAFLRSLTDEKMRNMNHLIPPRVPSGINVP